MNFGAASRALIVPLPEERRDRKAAPAPLNPALPQVQGFLREFEKIASAAFLAVLHFTQRSPQVLLHAVLADAQYGGNFVQSVSVQFGKHIHIAAPGLKQQSPEHGQLKLSIELHAWFGGRSADHRMLPHLPISQRRHRRDGAPHLSFVSLVLRFGETPVHQALSGMPRPFARPPGGHSPAR